MSDQPNARPALAVEPLDEGSRHFVPRVATRAVDERTQREEDMPSTEPDGNETIARIRDSVLSGLRLLEDAKQRTPLDVRVPDPVDVLLDRDKPTQPVRAESAPSDVFAPLGAQQRVIDEEAATPRDRPFRHIDQEKPTDIDPRAAPTLTMQAQQREPARALDRTESVERHEIENEQERNLVKSVYDTERAYDVLKNVDPRRAAHIDSLSAHLKKSGTYVERDLVLAIHAREKRALAEAPAELRQGREDRVLALGRVAYEVDAAYRARMTALKEHLIDELKGLPAEKRDVVFADFESFAERDVANDSNYCRRELGRAIQREQELKPYVFALALDKQRPRAANDADPPQAGADDASGSRRRS